MFYYDEPYEEPECLRCEEYDKAKQDAQEFMQGIVDMFYGCEKFDELGIENYISELAIYFELRVPQGEIKIEGKKNADFIGINNILQSWNHQNIKNLQPMLSA
jgi:hypothetical protein